MIEKKRLKAKEEAYEKAALSDKRLRYIRHDIENYSRAFEAGDMSMDRKHCIIHVEINKRGEIIHKVEDYDSLVGTFVMNEILQKKEKRIVEDSEIITLGATTLILKKGAPEE